MVKLCMGSESKLRYVSNVPLRDNTPEPAQRARYMRQILDNLGQVYTSRSISWKQQITAKLVVKGLGHQVVARSDELICAR